MLDGRELKGRLMASDGATLELSQTVGVTTISMTDVWQIESPDRLHNGARWGAMVGALVLGLEMYFTFLSSSESDLSPAGGFLFAGLGAGLGAVAGVMVDSLIEGRRVVYRAPGPFSLTVAPLISSQGTGVRAQVSW